VGAAAARPTWSASRICAPTSSEDSEPQLFRVQLVAARLRSHAQPPARTGRIPFRRISPSTSAMAGSDFTRSTSRGSTFGGRDPGAADRRYDPSTPALRGHYQFRGRQKEATRHEWFLAMLAARGPALAGMSLQFFLGSVLVSRRDDSIASSSNPRTGRLKRPKEMRWKQCRLSSTSTDGPLQATGWDPPCRDQARRKKARRVRKTRRERRVARRVMAVGRGATIVHASGVISCRPGGTSRS